MPRSSSQSPTIDHRPLGPFVVRSATLPFEVLEERLGAADRGEIERRLRDLANTPLVREALWLAAPELVKASESSQGQGNGEIERSIWNYVARMSGRPTPYGTFASVGVGRVGQSTVLRPAPSGQARKRIRLDALLLFELVQRWEGVPGVLQRLRFWPSAQLYTIGDRVRCSPLSMRITQRAGLVEMPRTASLMAVLRASREGLRMDELMGVLEKALPKASAARRQAYLETLIEAGVLFSGLLPAPTGPSMIEQLLEATREAPELAEPRGALAAVAEQLRALEQEPLGTDPGRYRPLVEFLAAPALKLTAKIPFHVDLWRPMEAATLGPRVVQEMKAVARLMASMPKPALMPSLRQFRDRFARRYGSRMVPLAEAIDEDHGVGFFKESFSGELPLLEGIPRGQGGANKDEWDRRERVLLARVMQAAAAGAQEIELEEGELGPETGPMPPHFSVMTGLAAASGEAADQGNFTLIEPFVLFHGSERFVVRFAGIDPAIDSLVQGFVEAQERTAGDVVDVNLVDLPLSRIANIVNHPPFRTYELLVQGRSGAPTERQLTVEDLLVAVEDGQIVLYSRSLQKRVEIAPLNAFNTAVPSTLPMHHFLGDLAIQREGTYVVWGSMFQASWLPRLRYRKSIVHAARWRLGEPELQPLRKARGQAVREQVQRLRERLRLPRWVSLSQGDNRLPIDLDNPYAAEVLGHALGRLNSAVLEEFLAAVLPRLMRSDEGTFVHDLVVPFVADTPPSQAPSRPVCLPEGPPIVPPGQGVLCAKVYGAQAQIESLLLKELGPLVGQAANWFFMHQRDALGDHLWLQVAGEPEWLWGAMQRGLMAAVGRAIARGVPGRLQIDSYVRETEHYGGELGLALSEQVAGADSRCCVVLLGMSEDPGVRWRLVALSVDRLLSDFGLTVAERLAFAEQANKSLLDRWSDRPKVVQTQGEQYRRQRQAIEEALQSNEAPWPEARQALVARSEALAPLARALRGAENEGKLGRTVESLVHRYVHATCNRLFGRMVAGQEMMLYGLLERRYREQLARREA